MFSLSTKTLLCVFLALALTNCKLTVRKPETLSKEFYVGKGIDYTVLTPQNKLTYKHKFVANLMMPTNSSACEPLPLISSSEDSYITNPVILATWGDCHYAQKVQNAQAAGAKMMILVLQHNMPLNHPQVRPLDIDTSIQVLAVSQSDGDKLIKYFTEEQKKKDKKPYDVVVEIQYSYDETKYVNYKSGDVVTIDYWFVAGDETKNSYELLIDLEDLLNAFGDRVKFTPRYVLWKNENFETDGYVTDDPRCVSGGRYCDPEPENGDKLYGAVSVIEDLRQLCFKSLDQKTTPNSYWWKYAKQFGTLCVDEDMSRIDKCRKERIYNELGFSDSTIQEVEKCMRQSFGVQDPKTDLTKQRGNNALLQAELDFSERNFGDYYPALYVNDEKYQDSFRNIVAIQDFICSHFEQKNAPSICETRINVNPISTESSDFGFYAFIVVVSIVIMAIMLYCVRRTVKRQVMGRMNEEISHIVTQYKQFKDKSTAGDDDL